MATIADLKPSITQLSAKEVFALIKETRFQRRQIPVKKIKAKTMGRKKPVNLKAQVAKLTPEQKRQLLKDLRC